MLDNQEYGGNSISGTANKSKSMRCRSFHLRYLELCRSKNIPPLSDIRKNNKDHVTLDFFGDKLSVSDWLNIAGALKGDQILQAISIRLRKCSGNVLAHLDSERKAKLFKQKPVIYTKFIFSEVVESLSNCIELNKNLRCLHLEGLPLSESYMECIAKSISSNTNIKELSLARSNILDYGCEVICNTVKYLDNVEILNLSDTGITTTGALHVADMIKIQKINRFTSGWQQSLRYREFDASNIPGLREILMARNPEIGDDGLIAIAEILKEDVWVKVIDMENCGITDRAATFLLDCLNGPNKFSVEFNVRGNPGISKLLLRHINDHSKKEEDCQRTSQDIIRDFTEGRVNGDELGKKLSVQQIIAILKATSEQLVFERRIRKKSEELNERLTAQIHAYENKLSSMTAGAVPEGYVIVHNAYLETVIKERDDLQKLAANREISYIESKEVETSHSVVRSSARAKKLSLRVHEETEISFKTPLPEPSVSPNESARSGDSQTVSARQRGQIRKVRSEMKYAEKPRRINSSKTKETKSDYEYGTESDIPQFETNIGDTMANVGAQHIAYNQQSVSRRSVQYSSNVQYVKKEDMDEISISTSRSHCSDAASAESETLRDNADPLIAYQQLQMKPIKNRKSSKEYGQGEGSNTATKQRRSPRSLFLGLCDD